MFVYLRWQLSPGLLRFYYAFATIGFSMYVLRTYFSTTATVPLAIFFILLLTTMLCVILFGPWLILGMVRIGLRIHDTGTATLSALRFSPLLVIKLFVALLITQLLTGILAIFLIIPGIYFAIRAWFYQYALVDGDGIFGAFATSFRITRGKGGLIFLLAVLQILPVTLASLLANLSKYKLPLLYKPLLVLCFITIFVTTIVTTLSNAYVYRLLKKSA